MAYKVLGQVTTVAPSTAPTVLNYVKDPSFSAVPITSNITVSTHSVYRGLTGSPWGFTCDNGSNFRFSSPSAGGSVFTGVTAPFGGANTAYGSAYITGSGWHFLTQGWASGQNPNTTPGNGNIDTATAIPVTAGTTYNVGWSSWTSSGYLNYTTFRVQWYNGGSYISNQEFDGTTGSNTWTRSTTTFTAPANATYAIIFLKGYTNGGGSHLYDGIVFGTDATYASTFVEPSFGLGAILSPYDKKQYGFDENTQYNTSISRNVPAGALQTLYTVPSGKQTVASTLVLSNMYAGVNSYRVVVQPSGESLAPKHFLFTDVPIGGNATETITIGMTLNAGDTVKVASDTSALSATLFGSEN